MSNKNLVLPQSAAAIGIVKMAQDFCKEKKNAVLHTGLIDAERKITEMREALLYYKQGIDHFYKCINFGKSNLDAEAIEFMNDSNIKISKALQ
jgi:hypothetical protein